MRTDWLTTLDPVIVMKNEPAAIVQTWRDAFGEGPPPLDVDPLDEEWDEVRVVADGSVYRRDGHRVLHRHGPTATILLVTDSGAVAPASAWTRVEAASRAEADVSALDNDEPGPEGATIVVDDDNEAELCDGRALFVMLRGEAWCASAWLPMHMDDFRDDVRRGEIDHNMPPDGVFVARLDLIDDGPGDYPGTRESAISVREWRPATDADWKEHRDEMWPWVVPARKGDAL